MKKLILIMLAFALCLCVLSFGVSATGDASLNSDNTGDLFGIVIAALLVSAMGVAALVANKTRFEQEKKESRQ